MDILNRIEALRADLAALKSADDARALWEHIARIDSFLAIDPGASQVEKDAVRRMRETHSNVIEAAVRYGDPQRGAGQMRVALSTLQSSIERRTTDENGWPLRR